MRKQHNHEPGQLRTPLRDVPISDRVNRSSFFRFFLGIGFGRTQRGSFFARTTVRQLSSLWKGLRNPAHQFYVYRELIMPNAIKILDVNVPVTVAHNQWTKFEEFPQFLSFVESITQVTDTLTV